ncbi:hypothetical protein IJG14_04225 [bacterium]|nr:hypothetical protein [bacterium]
MDYQKYIIKDNKELIKEITMEYVYKYAELKKRIQEVTTLLSISGTKEEFVEYYCRKYKTTVQMITKETVKEMIKSDFTRKIEHALEYKNKT